MADDTPQTEWPRPTVLEQSTAAANEAADTLADKADRAKEVAAEQTAGLRRDPASAAIVAQLTRQTELLVQIAEAGERKEAPAPGQFRTPFVSHVRVRATDWIIAVDGAAVIQLVSGALPIITVEFPAADTRVIPIPVTFDRGTNVAVTATGAGTVVDSVINGYPE